ncbi:hypothetical protein [Amycolatopsis rhizosphaerae]|uniref:hypothetical protein n=1 Tax=Amycolatopsis rhizosphaerae TaxID=2053003 RepID=UPI0016437FA8|nr:hypothetical protein [Amycolatopsis rhizosphaerae]
MKRWQLPKGEIGLTTANVIRLDQLAAAAAKLFEHVREVHGDTVEVDADYFWSIPPDALYNVYEEPEKLTIGQLSESEQHIRQLLEGQRPPLAYYLVWLSDLLRAVGYTVAGWPLPNLAHVQGGVLAQDAPPLDQAEQRSIYFWSVVPLAS